MKPLISFCLFTYNQEQFVQAAVNGALSQTYTPLEIIISDDNSIDKTFEIVARIISNYKGPHKVIINKNTKNLGLVPHVNYVLNNYVKGEFIAFAGGDDVSLPNRINISERLFQSFHEIKAVTVNFVTINEKSDVIEKEYYYENNLFKINSQYIRSVELGAGGGGLIIKKEVFEIFGNLNNDCPTEDSTLRFRSLLLGNVYLEKETLLLYRRHHSNLTNNLYSLSTRLIAKQYYTDLDKAYSMRLIKKPVYIILKFKILIYIMFRFLSALINKSNNKVMLFYKLLRKLVVMSAKICSYIPINYTKNR